MGATIYRVTGFFLTLTVFVFGVVTTVLLYFAGQSAIELVYQDRWAKDDLGRMTRQDPSVDWYGLAFLKGWALGFVYVLPGLTGLAAALFYNKCASVIHFTVGILILFVGSFLHTTGILGTVFYYIVFLKGLWKGQSYLGECAVIVLDEIREDENCVLARRSLVLLIAAMCTLCAGWVFLLTNVMFNAITYNNVKIYDQTKRKGKKYKNVDVEDREQTRTRRQTESTTLEQNENVPEEEPLPSTSTQRSEPSPSGSKTADIEHINPAFDAESDGGAAGGPIETESNTEKL